MKNLVDPRLANVFLKPGEVFVSRTPALVSTVLGSCVSVTLFSPTARMGAMCHALLPGGAEQDGPRYVDSAVAFMYAKLTAVSGQAGGFEAKLFGGANVLVKGAGREAGASVGSQNVAAALRVIERLGLPLVAFDTGGEQGRKIFFYSGTGEVYLRPVKKGVR
jgi:chemotaxis protein CheD